MFELSRWGVDLVGVVLGFVAGGIAVDATTAEPSPVVEVREDVFRVNALQAEVSRLEQELEDTRDELWTASADRDRFEATLRTVTAERDEYRAQAERCLDLTGPPFEEARAMGAPEKSPGCIDVSWADELLIAYSDTVQVFAAELARYETGSLVTACLAPFVGSAAGVPLFTWDDCIDRFTGGVMGTSR